MYNSLSLAAPGLCANVPECRSKAPGSLVLVQKPPQLQPSATLVRKLVAGKLKLSDQGPFMGGNYYLLSWTRFVEEIQFAHFHGSERQSAPNRTKESQFHISHVFRFAGAIGLPAIVNINSPDTDPPQQDDTEPEKDPTPELHPDGATDTNAPKHTPPSTIASEIKNLPRFSPVKAWYREKIFGSFANLPPSIRSEQSASREGKRSELFHNVDLLCAALEKTNLSGQDAEPADSDPKQNTGGTSNQRSGSGSTQQRTANSRKSGPQRKRNGKRSNKGSDNEDRDGHPNKKVKPDGPGPEEFLKCIIFKNSNAGHGGNYGYARCSGEDFHSFESMREHILRIHIRPYQCAYCWKRFGRKSERKRHEVTICKKKELVERAEGSPNDVPRHVIEIGEQVSRSLGVKKLYEILFLNGQKQYDSLDNTDVKRIPKPDQEIPEQAGPSNPVTITHFEERVVLEQTSNLFEGHTAGGASLSAEGTHLQSLGSHIQDLEDFTPEGYFDFLTQDWPEAQKLQPQHSNDLTEFTRDKDYIGDEDGLLKELSELPVPNKQETSSSQSIQKMLDLIDAESDPSSCQDLANELLSMFPQKAREALIAAAKKGPMVGSPGISSVQGAGPPPMQAPIQNKYAEQVASTDDNIPTPLEGAPDSAYVSAATEPRSPGNDAGGWMDFRTPFRNNQGLGDIDNIVAHQDAYL